MGAVQVEPLPEPEEPPVEPVEPVDETDADGNYLVTFTDASKRGELALKSGDGTVTFQDGEGANGYATVSKVDGMLTKALFVVGRSPEVENGFLQADVTTCPAAVWASPSASRTTATMSAWVYDIGSSWQITKNGTQGRLLRRRLLGQKRHQEPARGLRRHQGHCDHRRQPGLLSGHPRAGGHRLR